MADMAQPRESRLWLAVLLAGVLALAATLVLTARQQVGAADLKCAPPKGKPAAGEMVAVAQESFRLGQGLCIGVNPALLAAAPAGADAAAPREVTLQLFFDRHPTPATLTFDRDAPGTANRDWPGWYWRKLVLRPASSADSESGRKWRAVVSADGIAPYRIIAIGVAFKPGDGDAALPRAVARTKPALEVFNPLLTALGAAGLVAIAAGIVMACWNTGLLRDRTPAATGTDTPPFSLGRVQMAVWLALSVGGYLAIWLITGARSGLITEGLLALLGISAGSGLAARLIDTTDTGTARQTAQSAGFWRDIVSEGYGDQRTVAVHRLQMVAWTLILALIFVWTVLTTFSIPNFDTNLLLLMGLSSGTYLGFKFPEKAD